MNCSRLRPRKGPRQATPKGLTRFSLAGGEPIGRLSARTRGAARRCASTRATGRAAGEPEGA
jgi:hypothetical protein